VASRELLGNAGFLNPGRDEATGYSIQVGFVGMEGGAERFTGLQDGRLEYVFLENVWEVVSRAR